MADKNSVSTLKYTLKGSPWCRIRSSDTFTDLRYTLNGSPWFGYGGSNPTPTGHIKSINGVPWEHIKSYNGVAQSHIKTALGVEG